MRKEAKSHGENRHSRMNMRYTINKMLQIQVGVNLIRFQEGSSSWVEDESNQLDHEHRQLQYGN